MALIVKIQYLRIVNISFEMFVYLSFYLSNYSNNFILSLRNWLMILPTGATFSLRLKKIVQRIKSRNVHGINTVFWNITSLFNNVDKWTYQLFNNTCMNQFNICLNDRWHYIFLLFDILRGCFQVDDYVDWL